MNQALTEHYKVLGLHPGCTISELEKAYHGMNHEPRSESDSSGVNSGQCVKLAYNAILDHIQRQAQGSTQHSKGDSRIFRRFSSGHAHCYAKQVRNDVTMPPQNKFSAGFPRPDGPTFGFLHNAGGLPANSRWGRAQGGACKDTRPFRGLDRSKSTSFSGPPVPSVNDTAAQNSCASVSADSASSPHARVGTSVYLTEVLREADRRWKDAHGRHVPLSAYTCEPSMGLHPKRSATVFESDVGPVLTSDLDLFMERMPEVAGSGATAEGSQTPPEAAVAAETEAETEKENEKENGKEDEKMEKTPPLQASSTVVESLGTTTSGGPQLGERGRTPARPAGSEECPAPDMVGVGDDANSSRRPEGPSGHSEEPQPSSSSANSPPPFPPPQGAGETSPKSPEAPPRPSTAAADPARAPGPSPCKQPQEPKKPQGASRPLAAYEDTKMDSLIQERRILKKMLFMSQHCPEPADIAVMDDVDLYALLSMFEETTQRLRSVWSARMQRGVEFGLQCVRCRARPRQGSRVVGGKGTPGAGKTGACEGSSDTIELYMQDVRLACGDEHAGCMCASCAQTTTRCPICGAEQVFATPF